MVTNEYVRNLQLDVCEKQLYCGIEIALPDVKRCRRGVSNDAV